MLATLDLAASVSVATPIHSSELPQGSAVVLTSITAGDVDPNGIVPTLNAVPGAATLSGTVYFGAERNTLKIPMTIQ